MVIGPSKADVEETKREIDTLLPKLYEFRPVCNESLKDCVLAITAKKILTLSFKSAHEVLNHINQRTLKDLISKNRLKGIKIIGKLQKFDCDTCKITKSTILPHATKSEENLMVPVILSVDCDIQDHDLIDIF